MLHITTIHELFHSAFPDGTRPLVHGRLFNSFLDGVMKNLKEQMGDNFTSEVEEGNRATYEFLDLECFTNNFGAELDWLCEFWLVDQGSNSLLPSTLVKEGQGSKTNPPNELLYHRPEKDEDDNEVPRQRLFETKSANRVHEHFFPLLALFVATLEVGISKFPLGQHSTALTCCMKDAFVCRLRHAKAMRGGGRGKTSLVSLAGIIQSFGIALEERFYQLVRIYSHDEQVEECHLQCKNIRLFFELGNKKITIRLSEHSVSNSKKYEKTHTTFQFLSKKFLERIAYDQEQQQQEQDDEISSLPSLSELENNNNNNTDDAEGAWNTSATSLGDGSTRTSIESIGNGSVRRSREQNNESSQQNQKPSRADFFKANPILTQTSRAKDAVNSAMEKAGNDQKTSMMQMKTGKTDILAGISDEDDEAAHSPLPVAQQRKSNSSTKKASEGAGGSLGRGSFVGLGTEVQ